VIIGFLWIAWDCAEGFVGYQYTLWIWQTQHLPAGETIKRTDAAAAMRVLSQDLKDRHREVLVPALAMLVGGLVLGFSRRPIAEPGTPPNGGPATPLGSSGVTGGPPSVS
jgi:hypothetical protein